MTVAVVSSPASLFATPRRRRTALLVASVVIHLAILGPMALRSVTQGDQPLYEDRPVVYLDIEPRPLLPGERPRPIPAPPQVPVESTTARTTDAAAPRIAPPRKKADEDERPAPPAPRLVLPSSAVAPDAVPAQPVPDAWRVAPDSQAAANARALRGSPAGCRARHLLNRAEQALCDERFNQAAAEAAARRPIQGSGDAERDARFARQGAAALARYDQKRRPLSGGVGVLPPADCPGSNFGTGCAGAHLADVPGVDMRQGARSTTEAGARRPLSGD
ncbi:hypothetical protein ACFPIF_14315 [Brevundimonas faecalis]|uniref:hypothetical protein n=1 Tax=Brevundimonas faecalis TaxID=947378 RepID=UPI003606E36B